MTICKRRIFGCFLFFTLIIAVFFIFLQSKYTVPIMMYHNVNYSKQLTGYNANPQNFEKHMQFLKQHGYKVISLEQLVNIIKEKKPLPRKSVVITFDDGYQDNYDRA